MRNPKLGNEHQLISAYEILFESGAAKGKSCILVHNGGLEVLFSKTNALDIEYVKFNGKNVSFLSKNGINERKGGFDNRFEAGFLYTCGLENISRSVAGKPFHGSFHLIPAEDVTIITDENKVVICGTVKDTELQGKNLQMKRRFEIYSDRIEIFDTVENHAFVKDGYVILYHINYGYPFLDECLQLDFDVKSSEPIGDFAAEGMPDRFKITAPVDGGDEQCYYHEMNSGNVKLTNREIGVKVEMKYDTKMLPTTVEWKCMESGDYALGIEPATTRFDPFKLVEIEGGESKEYKLTVSFSAVK